jgi:hypothetical protein
LRSQVCSTEVIVVRPSTADIELCCGGEPMVDIASDVSPGGTPAPGLDTGTQLGKRYTTDDDEGALELLTTKQGDGTLSSGAVPLVVKGAKPLPSSD